MVFICCGKRRLRICWPCYIAYWTERHQQDVARLFVICTCTNLPSPHPVGGNYSSSLTIRFNRVCNKFSICRIMYNTVHNVLIWLTQLHQQQCLAVWGQSLHSINLEPVITSSDITRNCWKSHRQLFHPCWVSSVWRTDGCFATGCLRIHHQ